MLSHRRAGYDAGQGTEKDQLTAVQVGRLSCSASLWSHLGGPFQVDHDLVERVAGLHRAQCLWHFVKGIGLEHLGIDFASGHQTGDGGNTRRTGTQEAASQLRDDFGIKWLSIYMTAWCRVVNGEG